MGPFFDYGCFDVVRDVGSVFGEDCDASIACSMVVESLIEYCGYFLRCSVAGLVCPAGKVVSSFVVPFPVVFVMVMDELDKGLVFTIKGFFNRFHVMHIVLEG